MSAALPSAANGLFGFNDPSGRVAGSAIEFVLRGVPAWICAGTPGKEVFTS